MALCRIVTEGYVLSKLCAETCPDMSHDEKCKRESLDSYIATASSRKQL
jgi:hypothetical protein